MTVIAYNRTTPDIVIPYITRDQYRCAPTAIDTQSLVRGGSQADQDAELDRIILAASAWCDNSAEQPLTAQTSTEGMRARVNDQGTLSLHPRQNPVVAVTGVSFGVDGNLLSTLTDFSRVWVENQSVIVPLQSALTTGFTGPLQFGTARPGARVFVQLTYVAGWAVTTLTAPCLATDTSVTVKDVTGIIPGLQFRVQQGGAPSQLGPDQNSLLNALVVVSSVVGSTVNLTGQVGAAFNTGAAFTCLPHEVEQAAIYATTAMLKQPGNGALMMRGGNAGTVSKDDEPGAEEFDIAEAILASYRPVAP